MFIYVYDSLDDQFFMKPVVSHPKPRILAHSYLQEAVSSATESSQSNREDQNTASELASLESLFKLIFELQT